MTAVRSRRGRRVHIVAVDASNEGAAVCGRAPGMTGWIVALRIPDCPECLAITGARLRRPRKPAGLGTRLARRR